MIADFIKNIKDEFLNWVFDIGPNILFALIALIVGVIAIKFLMRILRRFLKKSKIELSLKTFVESLTVFILYGILGAIVGTTLGIKATSFIAVFGAAGIAVGLALQGSLANFAGGVLILVFKPFKVGDLIEVNKNKGDVVKIDILYTRIKTFDGRIITMPNGKVANSDIDNRTMEEIRRIDLKLKFSYDEDIDRLKNIIVKAMRDNPKIHKTPEPDVWIDEIGEYEIKVVARSWADSTDYWPSYWVQLEAVKKALDKEGIKIPIPKKEIFQGQNA